MVEIVFILIIAYAVYMSLSSVTGDQSQKEEAVDTKPDVSAAVAPAEIKKQEKAVVEKKAEVAKKTVVKKKQPAKSKTRTELPAGSLRNPETGEVAKIASQYRMTKRWIKDALVTEGLLEKIYKSNEIDDAAKVKINKALAKLAKMEKYQ